MVDRTPVAVLQLDAKALGGLGPKMLALNPRQRAFVVAMLETGGSNYSQCARMAGYADAKDASLRWQGHMLAHNEKVQAALQEQAGRRMKAGAILAAGTLLEIASNPVHKDQLKAAVELLNRTGLHGITEAKVTHEHTISDKAMIARVVELAKAQGLDPRKLLGGYGVTLDAEFEEVEDSDPEHSDEGLEDLL